MSNRFKKISRSNILIAIFAVAGIIYFSGKLGAGEFLNNQVAYGYGGGLGGIILPPITAVNQPLYLSLPEREGKLFQNGQGNSLLELEVPPLAVSKYTIFEIKEMAMTDYNRLCEDNNGSIVGNQIFSLSAKTLDDKLVGTFFRDLSISITLPTLPGDVSNLGIYFLNNNNQWVLGKKTDFNLQNKVTFQVNSLGTFAIINSLGTPRVIETHNRCVSSGQVLGEKQYAEGSLLRTCDLQVYVIEGQKAKQIAVVAAPQTHYQGKQIFDVDFETLYQYLDSDQRVLRERDYKDGELLRACDWRIFRLENQRANHVGTLTELRDKYEGQIIYNVDYWILKRYLEPDPAKLKQVLGIKTYADGSLIRTTDQKIYIIENQKARYISDPAELINYKDKNIFNVEYSVLTQYSEPTLVDNMPQKVLGIKTYADGSLLRTRDFKIYLIESQKARHIATLPGPNTTYQGKIIYDVDYSALAQYQEKIPAQPTSQVLGIKTYADGSLIRTTDQKIYIIENQKARYINSLSELQSYQGRNIFNVGSDVLAYYQTSQPSELPLRVLGVKRYGDGVILKTPDWRLYEIKDQKAIFITAVASPQEYYNGKKVYNVNYEVLAQYK